GVHVQRVHDAAAAQVVDEGLEEDRVVVPVVEGSGAGEEVEVGAAVLGLHGAARRRGERGGPVPAVAADLGLQLLEDVGAAAGRWCGGTGGAARRDGGHGAVRAHGSFHGPAAVTGHAGVGWVLLGGGRTAQASGPMRNTSSASWPSGNDS